MKREGKGIRVRKIHCLYILMCLQLMSCSFTKKGAVPSTVSNDAAPIPDVQYSIAAKFGDLEEVQTRVFTPRGAMGFEIDSPLVSPVQVPSELSISMRTKNISEASYVIKANADSLSESHELETKVDLIERGDQSLDLKIRVLGLNYVLASKPANEIRLIILVSSQGQIVKHTIAIRTPPETMAISYSDRETRDLQEVVLGNSQIAVLLRAYLLKNGSKWPYQTSIHTKLDGSYIQQVSEISYSQGTCSTSRSETLIYRELSKTFLFVPESTAPQDLAKALSSKEDSILETTIQPTGALRMLLYVVINEVDKLPVTGAANWCEITQKVPMHDYCTGTYCSRRELCCYKGSIFMERCFHTNCSRDGKCDIPDKSVPEIFWTYGGCLEDTPIKGPSTDHYFGKKITGNAYKLNIAENDAEFRYGDIPKQTPYESGKLDYASVTPVILDGFMNMDYDKIEFSNSIQCKYSKVPDQWGN